MIFTLSTYAGFITLDLLAGRATATGWDGEYRVYMMPEDVMGEILQHIEAVLLEIHDVE